MKRKYYPSTIKPFELLSKKEKKNIKFSLVLEKEKALQMEFAYSINSFERLLATIEWDLLYKDYLDNRYKLEELKAMYNGKSYSDKKFKPKFDYSFNPLVLDLIKNKSAIYMFINKVNKKIYIGKTIDLFTRIKFYTKQHFQMDSSNSKIFKALLKYKFNNFAFSIIEYCPIEDLRYKEQFYIDLLQPQYNIRRNTHRNYFAKSIDI